MKPPICEVCNVWFDPDTDGGGLVEFDIDEATTAFDHRTSQSGVAGHRPDNGWLCSEHIAAARSWSTGMTLGQAVREITGKPAEAPGNAEECSAATSSVAPDTSSTPVVESSEMPETGREMPLPDPSFAEVDSAVYSIAPRIGSEVGSILHDRVSALGASLGALEMTCVSSGAGQTDDPDDLVWTAPGATCSTSRSSWRDGNACVFVLTSTHGIDGETVGEHARLLIQVDGRSVWEIVAAASAEAAAAHDGRVLIDRAHVRVHPDSRRSLTDAGAEVLTDLRVPGPDPFQLSPDIDGVDLGSGRVCRGVSAGESTIEWPLELMPLARARETLLGLVPMLFDAFDLGPPPDLEMRTERQWVPMDGARPPRCPFVDHVIHESAPVAGRNPLTVATDQACWSEDDISVVEGRLFVHIDGLDVSVFVHGRGMQDACTSLTLFRPTSGVVVAALRRAFASWLP